MFEMARISLQTKRCPFCAERIQALAVKCRFCGEFLDGSKAAASPSNQPAPPQSAQAKKGPDAVLFEARPSLWALAGPAVKGLILFVVGVLLMFYPLEARLLPNLAAESASLFGICRAVAGLCLAAIVLLVLAAKIIRLKCIRYRITADRIEWARGVFEKKVDNLDMFRIIDLKMRRTPLDWLVGIGTVTAITTDQTDPQFTFQKIRHPGRLYDCLKKASLDADRRRTVVHLE